jgi:DNA-binding MarR family transcriptional regulator
MTPSTNTLNRLVLSTDSVRGDFVISDPSKVRRSSRSLARERNAVYSYIRALRSLGKTRLNTSDIAEALSLSIEQVNRAIRALEEKGVKVSNG